MAATYGKSFVYETERQVSLNGSYNMNYTMDMVKKDMNLFDELSKKLNTELEISQYVLKIYKEDRKKF